MNENKPPLSLVKKSNFPTCPKQLKMSFVTIFDKKLVINNSFSHLRQVEKWGFSSNIYIKYQIKFLTTKSLHQSKN